MARHSRAAPSSQRRPPDSRGSPRPDGRPAEIQPAVFGRSAGTTPSWHPPNEPSLPDHRREPDRRRICWDGSRPVRRDRIDGRVARTPAMQGMSPSTFSWPVAHLQGPSPSMDMIRTLRTLLDPMIEQTCFMLTESQPLDRGTSKRFGFLEYHGTLEDDRIVRLGVYQLAAWRTISAEMWVPDDVRRMPPRRASNRSRCIVGYGRMTSSRTVTYSRERSSRKSRPGSGHAVRPNQIPKRHRLGAEPCLRSRRETVKHPPDGAT